MASYLSKFTGEKIDFILSLFSNTGIDQVDGIVKRDGSTGHFTAAIREEAAEDGTDLTLVTTGDIAKWDAMIPLAQKGVAEGVAPLNSSRLIDATYLPSYIDDVLEYDNLASFPVEGETGKIYVDTYTNKIYRWTGTTYVEISPGTIVTVTPDITTGVRSAVITVNGDTYDIFVPEDTQVDMTARGNTKAYLLGTTLNPTTAIQSTTTVAESGIYFDTTEGTLVANTFVGNLTGVASGNLTSDSTLSWGKLAETPTTLNGYGITDANINNGVITLGNNTITPLTSFTEEDPIFVDSPAYNITSEDIVNWNNKTDNVGTITEVKTIAGSHSVIDISSGIVNFNVPTKTSHLENDKGYLTSADLPEGASAYTGVISEVGLTSNTGANNGFARGDHVHNITKATIDSAIGVTTDTDKFYRSDGTWATSTTVQINRW